MAVQPAFMLIADIGGYTRFMKMHRMSLAHAHEIIARLLETVIDSARGLTLAKLEGDAAFFYLPCSTSDKTNLEFLSDQVATMHSAFHRHIKEMIASNICMCDACQQIENLRIKFIGHFGEAAIHKVKHLTELAGVDVILLHRLLKNNVPVPEYLLMTEPVLQRLNGPLRQCAAALPVVLEDLGEVSAYYVDVSQMAIDVPSIPRRSWLYRLRYGLTLDFHTIQYMLGWRKPCAGYRNVQGTRPGN
jgi:hypothetical protein